MRHPWVNPNSLAGMTLGSLPAGIVLPPEEAEYNVLYVYFHGTPVASLFSGVNGTAPLNYLQIYSDDILYATAHQHSPATIVLPNGNSAVFTAQDLLNLASQSLMSIAEPAH